MKGFTLIELLAVILILGIIALIAVPQVTNVIGNANKGASETSAEHYIGAVNTKIGLNKLDSDSTNDITDGGKSIDKITVDMTGEIPNEGTVIIKNGVVDSALLVVNGHELFCDSKGKCSVIEGYVYITSGEGITEVSEGLTERPTNTVYIRYPYSGNTLGNPQACLEEDDKELCVIPNSSETERDKLLLYYGFDKKTMTGTEYIRPTDIMYEYKNGANRFHQYFTLEREHCVDQAYKSRTGFLTVELYLKDGSVVVSDTGTSKFCVINSDYTLNCSNY